MSKIDKMSILGIRSFDNVRTESIQFYSPLTLIVGTNGSGKTTIIECLKFATTGELPPNTKIGGAFIHDPKLAGEREVLGQVKLSFKSTEGARMVCTRSLQLTVKKTARSVTTLDSTIMIRNHGEKRTVSSRVVEMNNLMPRYIGVSKAVLDNVIFCHQDESLWPLSSASDLKKKFDELFEALKYTKAIENIKILQKQQRELLISYKKDEEKHKVDKARGKKATDEIAKINDQINELKEKKKTLAVDIKEAAKKVNEAMTGAERVGVIVGQLDGKRIEKRAKQESVDSLREDLEEFSETDEQLASMLAQYEKRMQHVEDDQKEARAQYNAVTNEIESMRGQISAQDRECGTYEAEKLSNDRRVELRQKLIQETARAHGMVGFDVDVDHDKALDFIDRINRIARDQTAALERARREAQESLQVEQRQLNEVSQQKSALNQAKENARQSINSFSRKLETLRTQLGKIQMDDISKQNLESQETAARSKLDKARSEMESAAFVEQMEELNTEMQKNDDRKEKLDGELAEASRQAADIAELQYVKEQLEEQRKTLSTMKSAHGQNISRLLGDGWTAVDVKSKYDDLIAERAADLRDAEKQLDGLNHELDSAQKQHSAARNDLKKTKESMNLAGKKIADTMLIEPENYPQELAEVTDAYTRLTSDAASSERLVEYFDVCIKMAKETQCCRTCRRRFEGANSRTQIEKVIATLEDEKKKQNLADVNNDLAEVTQSYEAAKKLGPVFEEYDRLKNKEINKLETEANRLSDSCKTKSDQVESQLGVVNQKREAVREVETISRAVDSISTSSRAIKDHEDKVKDLQAKQQAAGITRGAEAISEDQQKLSAETRNLKGKLAKITGERDRAMKQLNALQVEHGQVEKKLSAAVWQMKERQGLEDQITDMRSQMQEQNETITKKDQELKALEPQRDQAQARYDDIALRTATRDRELQGQVNKLNNSKNELKLANDEIVAYVQRDGPQQLQRGKAKLDTLKGTLKDLQGQQNKIISDVKALEKEAADKGNVKRKISENMRYRRDVKALAKVEAEIVDLESRDAEADKLRFEAEAQQHHQVRQKLMSEESGIQGRLSSLDDVIKQLLANYDADYKNAGRDYKESHIRVETCKACIEDLGRYGGALDQAIMKYHSLKMEEINRIIDELWRRTYQGTDVDTIMIRSESENLRANKSYNYRVVMMKQDTEMDMRGRCSAGQKVLACIIIRLALAECFGINCGIIALDEPTTNLDRDNIRALAISLGEIIKVRKAQKNLQVIVITHDEEFLRLMNCSDHTEHYYRVSRTDRQKSQIERCPITDVV